MVERNPSILAGAGGRGDDPDEGPRAAGARVVDRHVRVDRPCRRQARAAGQARPRSAPAPARPRPRAAAPPKPIPALVRGRRRRAAAARGRARAIRRIVKTKRSNMKPMHLKEAAPQLELVGHDFFGFLPRRPTRWPSSTAGATATRGHRAGPGPSAAQRAVDRPTRRPDGPSPCSCRHAPPASGARPARTTRSPAMARWTPDPTSTRRPAWRWRRRAESLPTSACSTRPARAARRDRRARRSTPARRPTARWSAALDMPHAGDELHHFGWNACSSALCPYAPHPHVERRYLLVPGPALLAHLRHRHQARPARAADRQGRSRPRSSRDRTGYSRPHTVHCGPDGIYVSALGAPGRRRPGRHLRARPRDLRGAGARGRSTAGRSSSPTTSGGTSATTRLITSEWGTPTWSRTASTRSCCSAGEYGHSSTSGTCAAPPLPGARPRRRAPDGARAAAGARPDQGLRLRRRRDLLEGPVGRRSGCGTGRRPRVGECEKVIEIPAEPADADAAAAAAQAVRRGAAAGHRHQPVARRPLPLRLLLGHRRASASTT